MTDHPEAPRLTEREKEAVSECLAEIREMWRLLEPVVTSLLAQARRKENWRIAEEVAARFASHDQDTP